MYMNGSSEQEERSVRIDEQRLDVAMGLARIKTDRDLARKANVSYQTISNIRRTGVTTWRNWEALASALECSPFDLVVTRGFPDPKLVALVAL